MVRGASAKPCEGEGDGCDETALAAQIAKRGRHHKNIAA